MRRALRLSVLALVVFAVWQWRTWPDVRSLARTNPTTTAFIEADRARGVEVQSHWIDYDEISDHLKVAVLVAEDVNFFSHRGFERREIREALRVAWERKKLPRGASTITQQLAKNLWLSPSRNPWRKAKEALLTLSLERHLPKRRILELYLNLAEFGPGLFGCEAAAQRYYGRSASSIGLHRAAQLAATLPSPAANPAHPTEAWRARARRVERRARAAAWLYREI